MSLLTRRFLPVLFGAICLCTLVGHTHAWEKIDCNKTASAVGTGHSCATFNKKKKAIKQAKKEAAENLALACKEKKSNDYCADTCTEAGYLNGQSATATIVYTKKSGPTDGADCGVDYKYKAEGKCCCTCQETTSTD